MPFVYISAMHLIGPASDGADSQGWGVDSLNGADRPGGADSLREMDSPGEGDSQIGWNSLGVGVDKLGGVDSLWDCIAGKQSCLRRVEDKQLSQFPKFAGAINKIVWKKISEAAAGYEFTPFESLAWYSAQAALSGFQPEKNNTAFILSTTKGNIAGLGRLPDERIALHSSARRIARALGISKAMVVSQACISGLAAILYGARLLEAGRYDQVVITGADVLSSFVSSGFESFHAVDKEKCRPFDSNRKGISLGEAAATIVLSRQQEGALARLAGGAITNDANHISGPSRTGHELAMAIERALQEAGITAADIDAISAHGTATLYNDEMESKAFARCGLLQVPLHSVKGATGHTLGAAGVVESVLVAACLQRQIMLPSVGFESLGVSEPVHVCTEAVSLPLRYMLKTASGFGGANAALIWEKM